MHCCSSAWFQELERTRDVLTNETHCWRHAAQYGQYSKTGPPQGRWAALSLLLVGCFYLRYICVTRNTEVRVVGHVIILYPPTIVFTAANKRPSVNSSTSHPQSRIVTPLLLAGFLVVKPRILIFFWERERTAPLDADLACPLFCDPSYQVKSCKSFQ